MSKYRSLLIFCLLILISSAGVAWQIDEEPPVALYDENIREVLSPKVANHVLAIFEEGQELGNRAGIFSKVGDSLTVSRRFLYPFGIADYDTGEYDYLENIISAYSETNAHSGNSFINSSMASGEGWSANAVLNPVYANEQYCQPGESPLFCEYRLIRPSIALIMFGTNDAGFRTGREFSRDMQNIILITEGLGIIPVLSTIPNRPDVEAQIILFNDIIRDLALEHELPMIELYYETVNLPNYGLTFDNVHLSSPPNGLSASFDPINLQYGYTLRNFLSLEKLYAIHQVIDA